MVMIPRADQYRGSGLGARRSGSRQSADGGRSSDGRRRTVDRRAPNAERRIPSPGILHHMPSDVDAAVISNARLSDDYSVLSLEAPEIAALALPGQFVMVKPSRGHGPAAAAAFLDLRDPARSRRRADWHLALEQTHRDRHPAAVRGRIRRTRGVPRSARTSRSSRSTRQRRPGWSPAAWASHHF